MPTIPTQRTGLDTRVAASYGRPRAASINNKHTIALLPDRVDSEITVLTVTAPTDATAYGFTIADSRAAINGGTGITITVSATASGTDEDDLIALFVDDLEADANTDLILTYAVAAGTITFTALPGVTLTYTETADSTNDLAFATTAAGASPQYLYGEVVQMAAVDGLPDALYSRKAQKIIDADNASPYALVVQGPDDGFSLETYSTTTTVEVVGPFPGRAVSVVPLGGRNYAPISVPATSSLIVNGDPVYAGATGAEQGKLYRDAGSGRSLVSGAIFTGLDRNDPTIAYVQT